MKPRKKVLLSILICTIESRDTMFRKLRTKLKKQIKSLNVPDIEIKYSRDNCEMSVGEKRNKLLKRCRGEYACFVDDDDDVSDDYIELIYKACSEGKDCVSLTGEITFLQNGVIKKFIHSIEYDEYAQDTICYYRPPNHLNPIKTSISKKFTFPEANHGEDYDWSMQICRSGLLKSESIINKIYYHYLYDSKK